MSMEHPTCNKSYQTNWWKAVAWANMWSIHLFQCLKSSCLIQLLNNKSRLNGSWCDKFSEVLITSMVILATVVWAFKQKIIGEGLFVIYPFVIAINEMDTVIETPVCLWQYKSTQSQAAATRMTSVLISQCILKKLNIMTFMKAGLTTEQLFRLHHYLPSAW